MPRTIATICLTLLASLAMAGTASADVFPTVADSLTISRAAIAGTPCARTLTITADPTLGALALDGWTAYDGTCNVSEAADITDPERRCDVAVHEAEHRAGFVAPAGQAYVAPDGTVDVHHAKTGIMVPWVGRWPACHAQLPKIVARITARLTTPRRAWTVTCKPAARATVHCRARSPLEQSRRFAVTIYGDNDYRVKRVLPRWHL